MKIFLFQCFTLTHLVSIAELRHLVGVIERLQTETHVITFLKKHLNSADVYHLTRMLYLSHMLNSAQCSMTHR